MEKTLACLSYMGVRNAHRPHLVQGLRAHREMLSATMHGSRSIHRSIRKNDVPCKNNLRLAHRDRRLVGQTMASPQLQEAACMSLKCRGAQAGRGQGWGVGGKAVRMGLTFT